MRCKKTYEPQLLLFEGSQEDEGANDDLKNSLHALIRSIKFIEAKGSFHQDSSEIGGQ